MEYRALLTGCYIFFILLSVSGGAALLLLVFLAAEIWRMARAGRQSDEWDEDP